MNIQRKQDLILGWGFTKVRHGEGLYERRIFSDDDYTEYWERHNPDVIQFYKHGVGLTHDYTIDWTLFDKEAV